MATGLTRIFSETGCVTVKFIHLFTQISQDILVTTLSKCAQMEYLAFVGLNQITVFDIQALIKNLPKLKKIKISTCSAIKVHYLMQCNYD